MIMVHRFILGFVIARGARIFACRIEFACFINKAYVIFWLDNEGCWIQGAATLRGIR